jgi:uncharacterized metal-binding protein YceD (DUF177 family)
MPAILTTSADNPDFARVVAVGGLRRPLPFDFAPDEREAAALARLLDARSVRKMRFQGELRPEGAGFALEGRLGATVVQTCVVTLEPVTSRIDAAVRRRFLPADAPAREVEVGLDDDDEIEPLADRIDLGMVAMEALALALPAYPRHPDAALEASAAPEGEAEAGEQEGEHPFASLAAYRERLRREE